MKPTLLQTLLNQPSRTYSTPDHNAYTTSSTSDPSRSKRSSYHSIKQDASRRLSQQLEQPTDHPTETTADSARTTRRRSLKRVSWAVELHENSQDDGVDMVNRPASPLSLPFSESGLSNHNLQPNDDAESSLGPVTPVKDNLAMRHDFYKVQSHPSLPSPPPPPPSSSSSFNRSTDPKSYQRADNTPASSSDDEDVFYTPLSSPRSSEVESEAALSPTNHLEVLKGEGSSTEEKMAHHSDAGATRSRPNKRLPPPAPLPLMGTDAPYSASRPVSNSSSNTPPSSAASTDGDAFSDYSWYYRSSESNTSHGSHSQSSTHSKSSSSKMRMAEQPRRRTFDVLPTSSSASTYSSGEIPSTTNVRPPRGSRSTSSTTSSHGNAHISRPAPLKSSDSWAKDVRWLVQPEEMTKDKAPATTSVRRRSSRRRRSNSAESLDRLLGLDSTSSNHPALSVPQRSPTAGSSQARPRQRSLSSHGSSLTAEQKRMSAVLEVDETNEAMLGFSPRHPSGRLPIDPNVRRSRTFSDGSRDRPSILSRSTAASARTVDIPNPLPVTNGEPSHQTGYSSLVLPRAGYTPAKNPLKVSDKVDLTRSGLAQTTMSTISITKNSAEVVTTRKKKRLSLPTSFFGSAHGRSLSEAATPARLADGLAQALSFTSMTSPPSKLQGSQVMVQVWAVGLDAIDRRIVESKVNGEGGGYGFVPGRSFVGKAVEVGWEVNTVQKGDWVMGLLELSKCGALAEFLVVDKRRVYPSPQPAPVGKLSVEQIALLPLWAVQSHRAVRTMACSGVFNNPGNKRALILCGNVEGSPELAIQQISKMGIDVTVQISEPNMSRSEILAMRSGARKVVRGPPINILANLPESTFGFVLDFVGGKDVWKASRRVLKDDASQFTTVVGDEPDLIPSVNAHVRSNLRSIRRAFAKKDSKSIGYEWVSPAADLDCEGEDIRDSLAVIGSMAQEGIIVPWVGGFRDEKVKMFERTPELFAGRREDGLDAVVKIVD
ncbi:hypothetical protein FRC03_009473 [Tulasnella sp. 419]|nr:hypothetical protein FRC03_009473 [Tulasnella sp. 419]